MSRRTIAVCALLAGLGAGCTSDRDAAEGEQRSARAADPGVGGGDGELRVQFVAGRIRPDTIRIRAGFAVGLIVSNRDATRHEFVVGREEGAGIFRQPFFRGVPVRSSGPTLAAEPPTHDTSRTGSTGDLVHPNVALSLAPREAAALSFTAPAERRGVWQIACFIPGHGERATLIVD